MSLSGEFGSSVSSPRLTRKNILKLVDEKGWEHQIELGDLVDLIVADLAERAVLTGAADKIAEELKTIIDDHFDRLLRRTDIEPSANLQVGQAQS